MQFLITVKLAKNPDHNPQKKVTANCPLDSDHECTDSTGEHHTFLFQRDGFWTADAIKLLWENRHPGVHVTRVESVVGVSI